jgi:DNA end-binding protein Ku
MAATVWKGYITFGLISIPVRLFVAARDERVSFHMLHKTCGTRIKQQLYCPHDERVVERSEIVKGYEISKGQWVEVTDEEIKNVAPPSSETMDILQFVKTDEVDPIYYDASYYIVPEEPGRRAYSLLLETMRKTGYAATAKIGMHQRENIVVIRPREQGLALHTIYYPNEVRAVPEYSRIKPAELKSQEVQLAEQLVNSLAGPFDPGKYHDEYEERLLQLVEAKAEGHAVAAEPAKKLAPVVDLMQALQRSLGESGKKPAHRAATKKTVSRTKTKTRIAS